MTKPDVRFLILAGTQLLLAAALAFGAVACAEGDDRVHRSEQHDFQLETVVTGLDHAWGLAFLPDGDLLVTERPGRLLRIDPDSGGKREIRGVPEVVTVGQGGLLDVALHPDFDGNRWVYLSYSAAGEGGYATHVARGRLSGQRLEDLEVLLVAEPFVNTARHFGSRLLFHNGYLFVTSGERGRKTHAQDLDKLHGKLIRLRPDGSVPEDNPFVGRSGDRPEIYSLGHRNPQGLAVHPETGRIWLHEHGPMGGDEINLSRAGANYGWPETTYGRAYSGERFAPKPPMEGYVSPAYQWTPSIAPSGMMFYTGDVFPEWRGDLFVGALKLTHLARLELDGARVADEERLLDDAGLRIRTVRQGPDGLIYLLVDTGNAPLLRLRPVN